MDEEFVVFKESWVEQFSFNEVGELVVFFGVECKVFKVECVFDWVMCESFGLLGLGGSLCGDVVKLVELEKMSWKNWIKE